MVAKVILDISTGELDRAFDYAVPSGMSLRLGERVTVPFGKSAQSKADGFVIGFSEFSEFPALKDILDAPDGFPVLTAEMLKLLELMRERFYLRYADILRLFLPARVRGGGKRLKRVAVVEDAEDKQVELTASQKSALFEIGADGVKKVLLHGVTGSGKTEIYMRLIKSALDAGKSAIMLVPEISLTPQILRNFRARFGGNVSVLHSMLSDGERQAEWLKLRSGESKIAVGARSAVFAPLENLGVIVVDEEHDHSYISESNPRYNTAEVAEMRAELNGAKLVLGSATPLIDTYKSALDGDYKLVVLPDRVNNGKMPELEFVNMSDELRGGNTGIFSGVLKSAIEKVLEEKQQAMIFLNRRGHSSFVMCKNCGYIAKCADCDVSLTYHERENTLKCHYCGKKYKMLTKCPECGVAFADGKLRFGKIGTEQVVRELERLFPDARVLRMDGDTTTNKNASANILDAFLKRSADLLVGTQMIAKGHDFSAVTLSAILDADMSLFVPSYRSAEQTFQLITQVAGRSGRGEYPGRVIVQSYQPAHYVFRFARNNDYKGFYEKESNIREVSKFPPYTKLVRVLVSSEKETLAVETTKKILLALKDKQKTAPESFIYMQATRAPVGRIQKKFRYQVLMRLLRDDETETLKTVYSAADAAKTKGVSIFVEINPANLG